MNYKKDISTILFLITILMIGSVSIQSIYCDNGSLNLTFSTNKNNYNLGEKVTVTGSVTPAQEGDKITISIFSPTNKEYKWDVFTDSNGEFKFLSPPLGSKGTYNILVLAERLGWTGASAEKTITASAAECKECLEPEEPVIIIREEETLTITEKETETMTETETQTETETETKTESKIETKTETATETVTQPFMEGGFLVPLIAGLAIGALAMFVGIRFLFRFLPIGWICFWLRWWVVQQYRRASALGDEARRLKDALDQGDWERSEAETRREYEETNKRATDAIKLARQYNDFLRRVCGVEYDPIHRRWTPRPSSTPPLDQY